MYLKTLTLRGFKSFASATTLRFEPGITCVVGPNGSGKSNVVDAFSWVMGQQGAKPLRGGKMEDVVFAGTAGRPALGRAEVTLTIDNSDGALPIDYAEVTISRLLFRTGQSEYAINGSQCRLLDVQELLSDTGLGREMHVIVGQGHLDDILNAGPEARRALIEEAAGVLKHRRRQEKALRKLDAMQANLTRLVDLPTELGRQLKPLGKQAGGHYPARLLRGVPAERVHGSLAACAPEQWVERAPRGGRHTVGGAGGLGDGVGKQRRLSTENEGQFVVAPGRVEFGEPLHAIIGSSRVVELAGGRDGRTQRIGVEEILIHMELVERLGGTAARALADETGGGVVSGIDGRPEVDEAEGRAGDIHDPDRLPELEHDAEPDILRVRRRTRAYTGRGDGDGQDTLPTDVGDGIEEPAFARIGGSGRPWDHGHKRRPRQCQRQKEGAPHGVTSSMRKRLPSW